MNFKQKIEQSLNRAVSNLGFQFEAVKLEHPAEALYGDYSSNLALVVHGQKEVYKTPREGAEAIVQELQKDHLLGEVVEKVDVAGPGFVNFFLKKEALVEILKTDLVLPQSPKGKTIVVDHSHPNIAKRFGIGHLRSTIIGQAIIKLYQSQGWNVVSDNFLGDWGTQFGSLIAAIKEKKLNAKDLSIDKLEKLYVEFNKNAKENPELWEAAKHWFKQLEDGDLESRKIWESVKKTSMEEFERIWKLLGVKFDYIHAESFFEDKIAKVLEDVREKGVGKESEGALIVKIPASETPLMLLKSDGATTYETRDLAAIKFWAKEFSPEIIAYEVGSEQALHFQQVFSVAQMLGYVSKDKLIHVQHGLYLGKDGKKMRTRTGKTIRLDEVLDEAIKRAGKLIKDKELSIKEKEKIARAVGIGAIKYFDLSHHHASDIIFNWDHIFQLEGNSAPYIQYTYARAQSVLAKFDNLNLKFEFKLKIENLKLENEELAILRHLYKYPEILSEASVQFAPNLVCSFLFELAQKYNTFYSKHRIIGDQASGIRLALTSATGIVLKSGLNILGIEAPERM